MLALLVGAVGVAQAQSAVMAPSYGDTASPGPYNRHQPTTLGVDVDPTVPELTNTGDPNPMNWLDSQNNSAWMQFQANNTQTPIIYLCVPNPVTISNVDLWNGNQLAPSDPIRAELPDLHVHGKV